MLHQTIILGNEAFTLRPLAMQDKDALGKYFQQLSDESKRRFQPHPMTAEYAAHLCDITAEDTALRLILLAEENVIGYFIVEMAMSIHEASRYATQEIELVTGRDALFAPSILDDYQNKGLSSLVMPIVLEIAKANNLRSLVLMGGTQETNARAIAFYEKFGFQKHGGYQTEMFNHDMRLVFSTEHDQTAA